MLDVFAGTGSMARAFRELGWETLTVDLNARMAPDVCCDVIEWDYRQFPRDHFDFVHASPPCTEYSRARTTAKTPRNLELADRLVEKALEIVAYFRPRAGYTVENPQTGLLKDRDVVAGLPWVDATYCMYAPPGYRKCTRFWTNLAGFWFPKCCGRDGMRCEFWDGRRHPCSAQRGPGNGPTDRRFTVHELHAMPHGLCLEIATAASWKLEEAESAEVEDATGAPGA